MAKLSEHFSLEELTASESAARLGIDNTPSPEQIDHLRVSASGMERVRNRLGSHSIHINSGFRSVGLNNAIGGVPTSAHCDGWGIDFICPGYGSNLAVATALASSGMAFDQLILEYGWVHISFDPRLRGEVLTKKSAASPYEHGLHG